MIAAANGADCGGNLRAWRRRQLRQTHGGRLRQALFVVDLQLRGLRAQFFVWTNVLLRDLAAQGVLH